MRLLILNVLFIVILNGCSSIDSSNTSISRPVIFPVDENYGIVLDDHGNLWYIELDENFDVDEIQKVCVKNVINFDYNGMTYHAVDKHGNVWFWSRTFPVLCEKIEREVMGGKVLKFTGYSGRNVTLFQDGTIDGKGFGGINFSSFHDIINVDISRLDRTIFAINQKGEILIAGENNKLISSDSTYIRKATNIPSLKNIVKVGQISSSMPNYYAIDKDENFYYWGHSFSGATPKLFEWPANCLISSSFLLSTKDGNIMGYKYKSKGAYNADLKLVAEKLPFDKGYDVFFLGQHSKRLFIWMKKGGYLFMTRLDRAQMMSLLHPIPKE